MGGPTRTSPHPGSSPRRAHPTRPYPASHRRRSRLHPPRRRSRQPVLLTGISPLRTSLGHRHLQQTVPTLERSLQRPRPRRRHDPPARPPCRSRFPQKRQLPAQRPRPRESANRQHTVTKTPPGEPTYNRWKGVNFQAVLTVCRIVTHRQSVGLLSLHTAQIVVAGVDRHPVEPCRERRLRLVTIRLTEDSEESLLGDVKGRITITEHAKTNTEDTVLVGPHQLVEPANIPTKKPENQIGVVCGSVRHRRRFSPTHATVSPTQPHRPAGSLTARSSTGLGRRSRRLWRRGR